MKARVWAYYVAIISSLCGKYMEDIGSNNSMFYSLEFAHTFTSVVILFLTLCILSSVCINYVFLYFCKRYIYVEIDIELQQKDAGTVA